MFPPGRKPKQSRQALSRAWNAHSSAGFLRGQGAETRRALLATPFGTRPERTPKPANAQTANLLNSGNSGSASSGSGSGISRGKSI